MDRSDLPLRGELLAAAVLTGLALSVLVVSGTADPARTPGRPARVDEGRATVEALTVAPGVGRRGAEARVEARARGRPEPQGAR